MLQNCCCPALSFSSSCAVAEVEGEALIRGVVAPLPREIVAVWSNIKKISDQSNKVELRKVIYLFRSKTYSCD